MSRRLFSCMLGLLLVACASSPATPLPSATLPPTIAPGKTATETSVATPAGAPLPEPTATPLPPPAAAAAPDLVLDLRQLMGQTVQVGLSQVFQVLPPKPNTEWQVDFSSEIIQPLTAPDAMAAPGPQGWFFQAIAAGTSPLVLTSIVHCDQPDPCPLMPMQIAITIEVH